MKTPFLPSLITVTLLLGGSAVASPYDQAYGVQWNFMIGTTGADIGGGSRVAVSDDGTVFVENSTSNNSTWGVGPTNSVNSGLGAITPLGGLLYGTTISGLPGMNNPNQNYCAGVHTSGNKAYYATYGNASQHWAGEDGKDGNRAMVWSLDSTGLASIGDQHSLSKYSDNAGTLRADPLQPTTTGLTPVAGQNRAAASALRDSTMDMVLVMDMAGGDFATLGDYGGYNLRSSGTANAYTPGIGVYNFTTNTLAGPAKQPIATYSGVAATWSNFSTYFSAGIDQNTGRYYGGGSAHTRGESNSDGWDPDGSGPAASIPFVNSTGSASRAGIGTAYDTAHNLLYAVTWDTIGWDGIYVIAPTSDATNNVFWGGEMGDDCHIELRDASGAVVWSDTFDQSSGGGVERIVGIEFDANGDPLVSGYFENGGAGGGAGTYDTFVRKYVMTAPNTYTEQWTTTAAGPAGARDLIYASAIDPDDDTLYLLSDSFGQLPNTTGHLYAGNSDLLVRKMIAGDFNADGIVDFANDVQTVGAATQPGPMLGVDTYDFDRDGDSTFPDDVHYLITELMDRLVGDVAQDSVVTDVDNADIGKVIGSLGVGAFYIEGDIDFDGDVDSDDLTAVTGAFAGAVNPAGYSAGSTGATLRYRAEDGNVRLSANEADGGIITSFQLENNVGTFVPANLTGPAGGSFGGTYLEATTSVIADSDTTLAGAGGVFDLGSIFPLGLDQAGLEAYLSTAVYTGAQGTGQKDFNIVLVGPFEFPFAITNITRPAPDMVTLTWRSKEGETYIVKYSTDLTDWSSDIGDGIPPDAGATTTATFTLTGGLELLGDLYFRVEKE